MCSNRCSCNSVCTWRTSATSSCRNREPMAMAAIATEAARLRLMQLASPCLPVGAYAFSQGLEAAIELGWIRNAADAQEWLGLQLAHSLAYVDLPLLFRTYEAFAASDVVQASYWNATLLACRETSELRLGDCATGSALARLLPE